jgi:hypothetical protein
VLASAKAVKASLKIGMRSSHFHMNTSFQSQSNLSDYTSVIINIGILIPIMMEISRNNTFKHSRGMGRSWRDAEKQLCWFLILHLGDNNVPILNFQIQVKKTSFKARLVASQQRFLKGE